MPREVARYRGGEAKLFGFLVGQVMKRSQGQGGPEAGERGAPGGAGALGRTGASAHGPAGRRHGRGTSSRSQ